MHSLFDLYLPLLGIKSVTLAYRDNALINSATQLGSHSLDFDIVLRVLLLVIHLNSEVLVI